MAIKEDAEKLLRIDSILFNRGVIVILLFKKQYTLVVYFKCRRFGYRARDYTQPNICNIYSQKGYL